MTLAHDASVFVKVCVFSSIFCSLNLNPCCRLGAQSSFEWSEGRVFGWKWNTSPHLLLDTEDVLQSGFLPQDEGRLLPLWTQWYSLISAWLLPPLLIMTAQWLRLPRRIYRWTTKRCDGSCRNWVLNWHARLLWGKLPCFQMNMLMQHTSPIRQPMSLGRQLAWRPCQTLSNQWHHSYSIVFHCIVFMVLFQNQKAIGFHHPSGPHYTPRLSQVLFFLVVGWAHWALANEPFKAFTQLTSTCRSWSFNQQCIEPLSCEVKPKPNPIAEWQVLVVKMSPCFRDQDVLMYESFDASRSDEPESWMQPVYCKR